MNISLEFLVDCLRIMLNSFSITNLTSFLRRLNLILLTEKKHGNFLIGTCQRYPITYIKWNRIFRKFLFDAAAVQRSLLIKFLSKQSFTNWHKLDLNSWPVWMQEFLVNLMYQLRALNQCKQISYPCYVSWLEIFRCINNTSITLTCKTE